MVEWLTTRLLLLLVLLLVSAKGRKEGQNAFSERRCSQREPFEVGKRFSHKKGGSSRFEGERRSQNGERSFSGKSGRDFRGQHGATSQWGNGSHLCSCLLVQLLVSAQSKTLEVGNKGMVAKGACYVGEKDLGDPGRGTVERGGGSIQGGKAGFCQSAIAARGGGGAHYTPAAVVGVAVGTEHPGEGVQKGHNRCRKDFRGEACLGVGRRGEGGGQPLLHAV